MAPTWKHVLSQLESGMPRLYAGVPGDDPDLLDEARDTGAYAVPFRDQRTAAFAAAGWARVSDRAAVLTLHSGPGFLNALTGVSEAYSARIPMIVITVASHAAEVGRGGFQHVPVEDYRHGLFSWVHRARGADDLDWAVSRAVYLAEVGTRAPVHIIVDPDDLVDGDSPSAPTDVHYAALPPRQTVDSLAPLSLLIRHAQRPVLIFGGGCRAQDVRTDGVALAERIGAMCLVTASGRGSFPEVHPQFGGLVGLYSPPDTLAALASADVLVVLGSRLEETARMGWTVDPDASIVQVDEDRLAMHRAFPTSTSVVCDTGDFLRLMRSSVVTSTVRELDSWWTPFETFVDAPSDGVSAASFWAMLSDSLGRSDIDVLAQENGLADLWGYYAPVFRLPDGVRTVVPGEQTALGFGIGAGLGAALAGNRVIAVGGDGAFSTNLATVAAAAETGADILYVVLDNGGFGWPSTTRSDTTLTDFRVTSGAAAVARAAGMPCEEVSTALDTARAVDRNLVADGPRMVVVTLADRSLFPPS